MDAYLDVLVAARARPMPVLGDGKSAVSCYGRQTILRQAKKEDVFLLDFAFGQSDDRHNNTTVGYFSRRLVVDRGRDAATHGSSYPVYEVRCKVSTGAHQHRHGV